MNYSNALTLILLIIRYLFQFITNQYKYGKWLLYVLKRKKQKNRYADVNWFINQIFMYICNSKNRFEWLMPIEANHPIPC